MLRLRNYHYSTQYDITHVTLVSYKRYRSLQFIVLFLKCGEKSIKIIHIDISTPFVALTTLNMTKQTKRLILF